MSISLLSEKEGNQDEIERSFERWREHEERWRVSRREREEKESVEERDCDNISSVTSSVVNLQSWKYLLGAAQFAL